jgi:hypothetical protein
LPWTDITAKARDNPQFLWLPPGGLEAIKRVAQTTAKWRERENGRIQRGPFPVDRTRVSVTEENRSDLGVVTLSVQALDAGQAPRIHYAEGSAVAESDPELTELRFNTSALRLSFLAVDTRRGHPTGEPYVWKNRITIQHTAWPSADGRRIELFARPSAAGIRYTVDASEPRDGQIYTGSFDVTPAMATGGKVLLRVLAVDGDIEGREDFSIAMLRAPGMMAPDAGGIIAPDQPPTLREHVNPAEAAELTLDLRQTSTEDFFAMVSALKTAGARASVGQIQVGLGQAASAMRLGSELRLTGESVAAIVDAVRQAMGQPDAIVTSQVRAVFFPTGRDLISFVEELRVEVDDPRDAVRQGGG